MAHDYAHSGFALGAGAKKPPPISEINAGGEICAEVFKNIGAWLEHTDKRVAEIQAMSNAHGAPVQDAKSKYLDDLRNIPGLEVKAAPQQTVGEAIRQGFEMKALAQAQAQQNFQNYPKDHPWAQRGVFAPLGEQLNREKDPDPMDKTEVAKMIEEEREKINKYVLGVNSRHIDFYHTPEPAPEPACKPYKAPRSRASLYIAGYLLAALGTFVHLQHYNDSFSKIAGGERVFLSVVVPPFWPVYWAGNGLYYVGQGVLALDNYVTSAFKPAPKAPAKSCTDDKSGSWAPDVEGVCHMPPVPQFNGLGLGDSLNPLIGTCTQVGQSFYCSNGSTTLKLPEAQ